MKFQCFYYPVLSNDGDIFRCNDGIRDFNFGDKVPTKTLFYNYNSSFVIFQNSKLFIVENEILKKEANIDDLKFPLKIIFNHGTQLTVDKKSDLSSVRLFLPGFFEKEKKLGELFFLSEVFIRKIRDTQYSIMNELTNSVRDVKYLNDEMQRATKGLLKQLRFIENEFIKLTEANSSLIDDYLKYMNFGDEEDMFKIGINEYFEDETEQYKEYKKNTLLYNRRPIYPKFKLNHLVESINKYK
ncbi:MAG: hypothetical protein RSG52_01680 [Terrisporobacter sp.]|uniref:hypothetical protein n=1 Tax=Terrisporobacter sp. TaxID=1965305 RepID=UPI002FC62392